MTAAAYRPMAITGLGCRFPGADGPRAFFQLLDEGRDAITRAADHRREIGTPGGWGGFLEGIDQFDADFFGISPREAAAMDPQQRLALEVCWEALEDAGLAAGALAGSRTGVYLGATWSDYLWLQRRNLGAEVGPHALTGTQLAVIANRVSYFLDLRGPSVVVDTASSASLVAVHLACLALQAGDCAVALAGGVNLILAGDSTLALSRLGTLAPDGRCRPFDARGAGYVRAEGCGVVVLRPLDEALRAGDRIYAVIRATAVNNDGASEGLTAPSRSAQEELLGEACRRAGARPEDLHYVEAHGTGTPVGDPAEAGALGAVLGAGREASRRLRVGSVKSNIGHAEAAAGVAGLIKVALGLQRGRMPATLHFERPNPAIDLDALGLQVLAAAEDWPPDRAALAGVSSFGVGGTSAHAILEPPPRAGPGARSPAEAEAEAAPRLAVLSACSDRALAAAAASLASALEEPGAPDLADVCHTLARRRTGHPHRMAVVARTSPELAAHLRAHAAGRTSPAVAVTRARPRGKLAFVFSGHGSQWTGMGRGLLEAEPAFRAALEACDAAVRARAGWSVIEALRDGEAGGPHERIERVQPVLFSVQVSLAALWEARGVSPDVVTGHSLGEIAAAHVAGVLALDEAARLVVLRSALIQRLTGQGAMAAVELSAEEARGHLERLGTPAEVAAWNGPRAAVIAGAPGAIERAVEALRGEGVFARIIKVGVPGHTAFVDPLLPELAAGIGELGGRPARVPLCSSVTGGVEDGARMGREHWVRNLRSPVLFWPALRQAVGLGCDTFVEISPHPILLPAVEQGLAALERDGALIPTLARDAAEPVAAAAALGALWACGGRVEWDRVLPPGQVVSLPGYPWQRRRHWLDAPQGPGAEAPVARPGLLPVDELAASPAPARRRRLQQHLRELLGGILSVPAESVDAERSFRGLGLDSILAMELRRRIEASLGLALTGPALWSHPTARELAAHVDGLLFPDRAGAGPAAPPPPPAAPHPDGGDLAPAEAERLLEAELRRLERAGGEP